MTSAHPLQLLPRPVRWESTLATEGPWIFKVTVSIVSEVVFQSKGVFMFLQPFCSHSSKWHSLFHASIFQEGRIQLIFLA